MRHIGRSSLAVVKQKTGPHKALWAALVLKWVHILPDLACWTKPLFLKAEGPKALALTVGSWHPNTFLLAQETEKIRAAVNHYAGQTIISRVQLKSVPTPTTTTPKQTPPQTIALEKKRWVENALAENNHFSDALRSSLQSFGEALCTKTQTD